MQEKPAIMISERRLEPAETCFWEVGGRIFFAPVDFFRFFLCREIEEKEAIMSQFSTTFTTELSFSWPQANYQASA